MGLPNYQHHYSQYHIICHRSRTDLDHTDTLSGSFHDFQNLGSGSDVDRDTQIRLFAIHELKQSLGHWIGVDGSSRTVRFGR